MTERLETFYVTCPFCTKDNVLYAKSCPVHRVRVFCWFCHVDSIHTRFTHKEERPRQWEPPQPTEHDKRRVRKGRRWQEREERGEYRRKQATYPSFYQSGSVSPRIQQQLGLRGIKL